MSRLISKVKAACGQVGAEIPASASHRVLQGWDSEKKVLFTLPTHVFIVFRLAVRKLEREPLT